MTNEPPRQVSPNVVQASGQVASDVVIALKAQPALLVIVVLNMIAIGMAAWFLGRLADSQQQHMRDLMRACFPLADSRGDFGGH
jgi:hypothetical protein